MVARIVFFIALIMIGLVFPWPIILLCTLIYISVYRGYELLFLGILLDAQFGVAHTSLVYTSASAALIIVAELIKPNISFYERFD